MANAEHTIENSCDGSFIISEYQRMYTATAKINMSYDKIKLKTKKIIYVMVRITH